VATEPSEPERDTAFLERVEIAPDYDGSLLMAVVGTRKLPGA
jgi:hypothetical protein